VADLLRFGERGFAPPQIVLRLPPIAVFIAQFGIEAGILQRDCIGIAASPTIPCC